MAKINLSPATRSTSWNPPPVEMVGCWRNTSSGAGDWEISANGNFYAVQRPIPYTISSNGLQFTWGPYLYDRIFGTPSSATPAGLVGGWQTSSGYIENLYLNADGSYRYHEPTVNSGPDLYGEYRATNSMLGTKELRAVIFVYGSELKFESVFSGNYRYQWSISGIVMTWIELSSGVTTEYISVACP